MCAYYVCIYSFQLFYGCIQFWIRTYIQTYSVSARIVRVLDALQTSDPKTSVEKNDLLIIKKIGKTILRKAFVKVYSLSAKEEKTLTVQ